MNAFTIKDIENLSGIKAHTIRIWEQRYTFLTPSRTETNIRFYSNNELQIILNIALLNKYGYKISHIDRMTQVEMSDKILSLPQVQAQQERLVNELIQCMVEIKVEEFETLLNSYIRSKGIERTITQIVFPFLERIGILWLTNHINPAQEHLVTNIIRQKLIIGIENTDYMEVPVKSAVLFLPEYEHHELALLFVYYLLKRKGVRVLYLGANVPLVDVAYIAKLKKPDFLYTHLTSATSNLTIEKFLGQTHKYLPSTPFIISGVLTQSYKKTLSPQIGLKKSLSEVMEYISSL